MPNKNKVIIPKTYVSRIKDPLIFLAGPIRGAPNWQAGAIEILLAEEPGLVIASPRRDPGVADYIIKGEKIDFQGSGNGKDIIWI